MRSSEFDELLKRWFFHSENIFKINSERKIQLINTLYKYLVDELKITKNLKISDASFKRNDDINQFGSNQK